MTNKKKLPHGIRHIIFDGHYISIFTEYWRIDKQIKSQHLKRNSFISCLFPHNIHSTTFCPYALTNFISDGASAEFSTNREVHNLVAHSWYSFQDIKENFRYVATGSPWQMKRTLSATNCSYDMLSWSATVYPVLFVFRKVVGQLSNNFQSNR